MEPYNPHKSEENVHKLWKDKGIYQKAKDVGKGKKPFYFLDGPPYTSGHVHIGTAWNKALKDAVLRYKRMRGLDVWDRAGYDMHGMPTERKVQHKLGLDSKEDILKFGMEKFVKECKEFAIANMNHMSEEFRKLGVWMDFDNAYMPITKDYMEGEWWLIKQAEKNGRLYQAEKTMHWCKDCSTALAKHELEYKNVNENSIFVKFKLAGKPNEYLIIWTTTPWTIPFNMGVMVHPELEYVRIKVDKEVWIVAKGLSGVFMSGVVGKNFEIIEELKGEQLAGLKYEHPQKPEIQFFKDCKIPKVHTVVLSSEYVDLSAGTGLVHMAPGCGPEDYEIGHREGIPPFNSLTENGVFPENMGKFAGLVAKRDDTKFVDDLKQRGALIAEASVEHEYAHCWRCKNPVIFRTTKQWFFKVEDLIPKMRELNKKIKWVPDWAGTNWFDSWLDKLRDNSITRQRFWGTPLPIWQCDKCESYEVIETVAELEKKAGSVPADLHKPWIDKPTWKCKCGGVMRRSPDILDVWIDAGTSSWNCLDFPRQKAMFEKLYPPDFILEGKDQIRGWFNLLLVTSMVAMGKPSFKACYMHGFVQDDSGRKMSKSLGNIITPGEVLKDFGADTFRLYAIGGANAGLDLNYNKDDIKVKHRSLAILWNVHNYLLEYANGEKLKELKKPKGLEEKYMLSKLHSTIAEATELMENYNIDKVPTKLEDLFLELSRTYIQLTREKINEPDEKQEVLDTIFTVLLRCTELLAPITPFIAEEIYQNLKGAFGLKGESVHLAAWPKADTKLIDNELESSMAVAEGFIQAILSAREKISRGLRWPLAEAVIVPADKESKKAVEGMIELISQQTNVKSVVIKPSFKAEYFVKPNFRSLGKRFGSKVPEVAEKITKEKPDKIVEGLSKGKLTLGGFELIPEDVIIEKKLPEGKIAAECRFGSVCLDTTPKPELEAEGMARELMRRIQNLRKKAGLSKSDSIKLDISGDEASVKSLAKWADAIKAKCGATSLSFNGKGKYKETEAHEISGKKLAIGFNLC